MSKPNVLNYELHPTSRHASYTSRKIELESKVDDNIKNLILRKNVEDGTVDGSRPHYLNGLCVTTISNFSPFFLRRLNNHGEVYLPLEHLPTIEVGSSVSYSGTNFENTMFADLLEFKEDKFIFCSDNPLWPLRMYKGKAHQSRFIPPKGGSLPVSRLMNWRLNNRNSIINSPVAEAVERARKGITNIRIHRELAGVVLTKALAKYKENISFARKDDDVLIGLDFFHLKKPYYHGFIMNSLLGGSFTAGVSFIGEDENVIFTDSVSNKEQV